MEMRRAEDGMRFWIAEPGGYHMSYSGELGGLWRRTTRLLSDLSKTIIDLSLKS